MLDGRSLGRKSAMGADSQGHGDRAGGEPQGDDQGQGGSPPSAPTTSLSMPSPANGGHSQNMFRVAARVAAPTASNWRPVRPCRRPNSFQKIQAAPARLTERAVKTTG